MIGSGNVVQRDGKEESLGELANQNSVYEKSHREAYYFISKLAYD